MSRARAFCNGFFLALLVLLVLIIYLLWIVSKQSSYCSCQLSHQTLSEYYRLRGELIFQDEFDFFNLTTWEHVFGGGNNNEFQFYSNSRNNSYVENGVLYIRPTLTINRFGENFLSTGTLDLREDGCIHTNQLNYNEAQCVVGIDGKGIIYPIQSARIRSKPRFSFTYGTAEIRAKMPRAIWLSPTENFFGPWPKSGEIDVVEVRGNDNFTCSNGKQLGNKRMASTLHYGFDSTANMWRPTHYARTLQQSNFSSDFHVFGVQRLPKSIRFYLDGELFGEAMPPDGGFWEMGKLDALPIENIWANGTNMSPFNKDFHFILNVAVGGGFFTDGCEGGEFKKPWMNNDTDRSKMRKDFWDARADWEPTWTSTALQVDYIRVYNYEPNSDGGCKKT